MHNALDLLVAEQNQIKIKKIIPLINKKNQFWLRKMEKKIYFYIQLFLLFISIHRTTWDHILVSNSNMKLKSNSIP